MICAGVVSFVDCDDLCRSGVLGTKTITAGEHGNILELGISKCSLDIQCQRLADGAGLFGPVEDGDLLHAVGDSCEECLGAERSVQTNLDYADLLALGSEVIDSLFNGLVDGTHCDDDLLGIGSAVVVEQLVVCADLGR